MSDKENIDGVISILHILRIVMPPFVFVLIFLILTRVADFDQTLSLGIAALMAIADFIGLTVVKSQLEARRR